MEQEINVNFTKFLEIYDNDPGHKKLIADMGITEQTIKMLTATLEEAKEHETSEQTIAEIEANIRNNEVKLQFCKEALSVYNEKEFGPTPVKEDDRIFDEELTLVKPKVSEEDKRILNIIHTIEDAPITEDESEAQFVKENSYTLRQLQKQDPKDIYQIARPVLNNGFLVVLPADYDTVCNEVSNFMYNPVEKTIGLTIRESVGKRQPEGIWQYFESGKKHDIILYKLDSENNVVSKMFFKKVKLTNYFESTFNFSNNDVHEFYINLKYKKVELTRPADGPTGKRTSTEISE